MEGKPIYERWSLPKTAWTITGFSRAAYRTGFYIPELQILLDAGPQSISHTNPKHIFITHTHGDHIAALPFTMIVDSNANHKFQLYAPEEAEYHLRKFISSLFEVNSLKSREELCVDDTYTYNGFGKPSTIRINCNNTILDVDIVLCDHSIPTLSYCFNQVKQKLKKEYKGFTKNDILALRKSNIQITEEIITPTFAYICDTSILVLQNFPQIVTFPTIIIECTFLLPEERDNAYRTKHIHWEDLLPYVILHKDILFVLIHFSLRYKTPEIVEFFNIQKEIHSISNIKLWLNEEVSNNRTITGKSNGINGGGGTNRFTREMTYCQLCSKKIEMNESDT